MLDDESPPAKSFESLSPREHDILVLLAQDLTDREIAERLVLALTTVKWYNRQIFNKLGVESRQQAVEQALTLNLIERPKPLDVSLYNLPAQLTPFIGRIREVNALNDLLHNPDIRLATILAPGGMGKSRLALEVASSLSNDYTDGVCFVALAGITSSEPFVSTLIDALGFQFGADGRTPKQQLFTALRRKQLLLVLDNFEHLLDNAPLVAELLTDAPGVKALITSRERLNINGETVYPLTGLMISDPDLEGEDAQQDAEELFTVCAQRANLHAMTNDGENVRKVCRLVQGMPLAIEMAAAWSGTLSSADIAREIERSADFLQTTMPNVPTRLRSVRIVFEAAWSRLSAEAQRVFRRLSVFRGGCSREAAQVVTGANLRILPLLVDHALLWLNPQTERYEVHELLRQYAEQELRAAGEVDAAQDSHQRYYAQLTQTWGAAMLADKLLEGLAVLDADTENIRKALIHATTKATPEVIEPFTDLWIYYEVRCRWEEGDQLFIAAGKVLEPKDSLALAKLLTGRAIFYQRLLLFDSGLEVGKRAHEMILRLGARRDLPLTMFAYARALKSLGRHEEALPIYQEGLKVAQDVDFPLMEALFKYQLAGDAMLNRRWEEAEARMTEAYVQSAKLNHLWAMGLCRWNLAVLAHDGGNLETTQQYYIELLANARRIHFHLHEDMALLGLSDVAREHGDWQTVYRLNLEILRLRYDIAPSDRMFIVLTSIAEATWRLGDLEETRRYIRETLRVLREWKSAEQMLWKALSEVFVQLLYTAAGLLVDTRGYFRATILLSYAESMLPRCDPRTLVIKLFVLLLPDLLDRCRSALPPEAFAAARERSSGLSFDSVLTQISAIS